MPHSESAKQLSIPSGRPNYLTLRRAMEFPKELVLITDASGVVQYINSACEILTGYTANELIDSNLSHIAADLPKRDSWDFLRAKAVEKGVAHGTTSIRCKNGSLVELDMAITVVVNPRTRATMLACIGWAFAQEDSVVPEHHSSLGTNAIAAFTSGVVHDFNNLLMVIGAYAEMGLAAAGPEHAVRRNLQEIQASVRRASDLTRRLLMVGRKTKGEQLVSLNWIIEDAAAMLARIMEENIEVRVVLGKNIGMVSADPGQMEEVLLNLAVNARDAMPDGGELLIETHPVHLDRGVVNGGIAPADHVQLTISDNGRGMEAEELARIFEPYFTTKSEGKGTGLGLAIVQSIIQQSGGSISATSQPGAGTSIRIYLPIAGRAGKKPVGSSEEDIPAPRGDELLVLVEDADRLRQPLLEFLSSLGYTVISAANGVEALRALKKSHKKVALIVVDVVMPGMSGPEFVRAVASLRPDSRVLFISGYTEDVVRRKGVPAGDACFLQKPFSLKSLAIKIRELLDERVPARATATAAGR